MSVKTHRASVIRGGTNVSDALGAAGLTELKRTVRAQLTEAEALEADRAEAFQQGYNDGLLAAREEVAKAMEESSKSVKRALAALCEAVDAFETRETVALVEVEDAVINGAFQIARAVLQRELTVAANPGGEAIARAMSLLPDRGTVTARLHPEDVATLSLESISTTTRTVEVIGDSSIERGGCIVELGETRVDAQLSSALKNVHAALFGTCGSGISEVAGSDSTSSGTTASEAPLV